MYLVHHGIIGQKWGIRRYQNPDGTLTPKGRKHLEKEEHKWAKKNSEKIQAKAKKESQKELDAYGRELMSREGAFTSTGKLSASTMNAYNQKMAELMSQKTSNITSPSGRTVSFVAKRGELGVFMALSNSGYDPNAFKRGIWSNGREAYKKNVLNKYEI